MAKKAKKTRKCRARKAGKARARKAVRTVKRTSTVRANSAFRQPFAAAKAWGKIASQQPFTALQNSMNAFVGYFK